MVTLSGPPAQLPITDAHHHLWDLSARPQPFLHSDEALAPLRRSFAIAELEPQAAAAGVTSSVVIQTVTEPGETAELLALAAATPLLGAVVGWIDMEAPDASDAIGSLQAGPGGRFLAGLRHPLLTEPDPAWLSRSAVRRGLATAAAAGLSFDLVLRPGQLPDAVAAAAALPQLTFVLDHLGNPDIGSGLPPDPAWKGAFLAFARLSNTFCKLSGLAAAPASQDEAPSVGPLQPYADIALGAFGAERLMFGSDWPVSTLTARYRDVVATGLALISGLSPAERVAILTGTAHRVYGVPPREPR